MFEVHKKIGLTGGVRENQTERRRPFKAFSGTIIENVGLHARPAAVAVEEASKYQSDITLYYQDRTANMKSIIQIMKIGVPAGGHIEVRCQGEDEVQAAEGILQTLQAKHIVG